VAFVLYGWKMCRLTKGRTQTAGLLEQSAGELTEGWWKLLNEEHITSYMYWLHNNFMVQN